MLLHSFYYSINNYSEECFNCSSDYISLEVGSNDVTYRILANGFQLYYKAFSLLRIAQYSRMYISCCTFSNIEACSLLFICLLLLKRCGNKTDKLLLVNVIFFIYVENAATTKSHHIVLKCGNAFIWMLNNSAKNCLLVIS